MTRPRIELNLNYACFRSEGVLMRRGDDLVVEVLYERDGTWHRYTNMADFFTTAVPMDLEEATEFANL